MSSTDQIAQRLREIADRLRSSEVGEEEAEALAREAADLVGKASSEIEALRTPGCTSAVRASGSTRSARMNFAIESSTPSPGGSAPPDRPVPAPRGTTGMRSCAQVFKMRRTCSSVSGSATIIGSCR